MSTTRLPRLRRDRSRPRPPRGVVTVALVLAGAAAVGAYVFLRLRRFLGGALEGYPDDSPTSGRVVTGSVSSTVILDYDRGTAAKTYSHPTRIVRWLYRCCFQAPFPYTTNEDALQAARQQRRIAGLLTRYWFGEDLVAPILDVRRDPDGRFTLVAELVCGGVPRDLERAKALLHELTVRFEEAGLPTWQVGDYNPRAIGNLVECEDGALRIIDLESNFVTPFVPWRALPRLLRRGQYPAFDDIDVIRLRAYLAEHREDLGARLGGDRLRRLGDAVDAYERAAERWHDREPRLVSKALRLAFIAVDPARLRSGRVGMPRGR